MIDLKLEPKKSRIPVHNPDGSIKEWLLFVDFSRDNGRAIFEGQDGQLYNLETLDEIQMCRRERFKD